MKHLEILSLIRGASTTKYLFVFLFLFAAINVESQVKVGDSLPQFELFKQNSQWFNTDEIKNEKGVVFFFFKGKPSKKNTILKQYKNKHNLFKNLDVKVIGIGEDVIEDIFEFHKNERLPFALLSDSRGLALALFDMDEKKLKKGVLGFTFVVKKGKIVYIANIKENIENQIYTALGKFIEGN
ncbi:MAG TPA: redoxin domain-containing protein [Flavobacteriia bacterium]|nr:redoxin domain-containing protein [Flavobacteriia bacterium]